MSYLKFKAGFGFFIMLLHGRAIKGMEEIKVVWQPIISEAQRQAVATQTFAGLLSETIHLLQFYIRHFDRIKQVNFSELFQKTYMLYATIARSQTDEACGSPKPPVSPNLIPESAPNTPYFAPISPTQPLPHIPDETQEAPLFWLPVSLLREGAIRKTQAHEPRLQAFSDHLTAIKNLLCFVIDHYGYIGPDTIQALLAKMIALDAFISRVQIDEASGSPIQLSLSNPIQQAFADNAYFRPITPPSHLRPASEPLAYKLLQRPDPSELPVQANIQRKLPQEFYVDTSTTNSQKHTRLEPKPSDEGIYWKLDIDKRWNFVNGSRKRVTIPLPKEIKKEIIKLLRTTAPDGKKWNTRLVNQVLVSKGISVKPAQLAYLIRSFKRAESNKRKRG